MNTDEYVHYVAESVTPRAMSTREIEEASADNEELSNLRKCYREKNGTIYITRYIYIY